MGFWKKLFGIEDEDTKDTKEQYNSGRASDLDTVFVTPDEENAFENSMYGKVQLYKAELSYIIDIFPSEGLSLEKQIKLLTELMEKTNKESDDSQVVTAFKDFEQEFKRMKRLADGEYTIKQLEGQNSSMDKLFRSARWEKGVSREKIEEYVDYISRIQKKVNESDGTFEPLLTDVQRQRFNGISMKSEYRIRMLELMYLLREGEEFVNPFKNLSDVKQKMFSDYLLEDMKEASTYFDIVSSHEKSFKKADYESYPRTDELADELNNAVADASMIEDFSIRQLFDSENDEARSFEFLKKFVEFRMRLNSLYQDIDRVEEEVKRMDEADARRTEEKEKKEQERLAEEKRKEEEKRRAEEEEKLKAERLKNTSNEEIEREIFRIEHDISAKGSRFVNILDYQKYMARIKGLLTTESEVQRTDLMYKVVDSESLLDLIEKLQDTGTNYVIFPDSQEYRNGGYLVIVSQSDSDVLSIPGKKVRFGSVSYEYKKDEKMGTYTLGFLNRVYDSLDEKSRSYLKVEKVNDDNSLGGASYYNLYMAHYQYDSRPSNYKKILEEARETIQKTRESFESGVLSQEDLKDVFTYLEIPANQNIISVLEKMKAAGIPVFLEPEPANRKARNEMNRDNIHLYFRREDIEKYLEMAKTEPTLSAIPIRWGRDFSFGKMITSKYTWPTQKEINE